MSSEGQIAPGGDPGKEARAQTGIPVVPAFDGYRAYAIFGIVAMHLLIYSGLLPAIDSRFLSHAVTATLGQAIDVLFVISGFVVFLPTAARGGDFGGVRPYAVRRAARLVPAYWLVLAVSLVAIAAVPVAPPVAHPSLGNVLSHLAFLQEPIQMVHPMPIGFGVNGAVWTLSLEVAFYLLLPLIALPYARHPLAGLAAAAVLTAAWHEAFLHLGDVTSFLGMHPSPSTQLRLQTTAVSQFPFFAFSFAAGMTGAWAYVCLTAPERRAEAGRWAVPCLLASVAALALFAYLIGSNPGADIGPEVARRSPVVSIGFSAALAAAMVALTLAPRAWQLPFANPVVRGLGDISYGVYLIHVLLITYAVRALGSGRGSTVLGPGAAGLLGDGTVTYAAKLFVVVVPASLAYGWLSARLVEQPIRVWARRFGRRAEPSRA